MKEQYQQNADDLVVFSKLKHLTIWYCKKVFTLPFAQSFWEMIKATTNLRVLEMDWNSHNQEVVVAALKENGYIVDGGKYLTAGEHYFFEKNKENHARTLQCVVQLLAIRRCRNFHNHIPKEMFYMLGLSLWNTKCDVEWN